MGKKEKKDKGIEILKASTIFAIAVEESLLGPAERNYCFKIPNVNDPGEVVVKSYEASNGETRTTWMLQGTQCPKLGVKSLLDMVGRANDENPTTRKVPYTIAAQKWEKTHGKLIPETVPDKEEVADNESGEPVVKKLFSKKELKKKITKKEVKTVFKTCMSKKAGKKLLGVIFAEKERVRVKDVLSALENDEDILADETTAIIEALICQ